MATGIDPLAAAGLGVARIDLAGPDAQPPEGGPARSLQSLFDAAGGALAEAAGIGDDTVHEVLVASLREAASTDAYAAPVRVGETLVALRRLPVLTTRLEGAGPAWSAGLAAERRLGPIADRLGRELWIDVFRRVRQLRFVRSPGAPPFLALPVVQAVRAMRPGALRGGEPLDVAAGSLWFASGLVSDAPAGVYTGVRISGGTLRFSADVVLGGDEVVVPAQATIELTLGLAPPERDVDASDGEFAATRVRFPEGLRLVVRQGAARIEVLGDAALTAWGTEVALAPAAGDARYRADLHRLVLPMQPDAPAFRIGEVASTLFLPSGEAAIDAGGLALPAAAIAPDDLGDASGVGALLLALRAGLAATWQGEPQRADLGASLLLLDASRLAFAAAAARATGRVARWRLQGPAAAQGTAELADARIDGAPVHYVAMADGAETVAHTAAVDVRPPKPVDVAGRRVGARLPAAQVLVGGRGDGARSLMVLGHASAPAPGARGAPAGLAFGLTNALLRATPPRAVLATGRLDGDAVVEGQVLTAYGLAGVLPSLPDPYAANTVLDPKFGAADQGGLVSRYGFRPDGEALDFALPSGAVVEAGGVRGPAPFGATPAARDAWMGKAGPGRGLGDLLDFEEQPKIVLLDVSTQASRFGVALRPPRPEQRKASAEHPFHPPAVRGLELAVDGRFMVLLALPAVQWEPVRALPGPEPFPDEVRFANSGVPTTIDVPSVNLVPLQPIAAYRTILDNFAGHAPRTSHARFTLPFGLLAKATLSAPSSVAGARVAEVRPEADGLLGAHQLRLEAVDPTLAPAETPALPGFAVQLPVAQPTDGGAPVSVLGDSVTWIFNGYLGAGQPTALVPVTRVDLSGHGESLFSDWANPDDPETGVSKAEFQVLNGRAAHEVIQVKSILLPYFVPVVRTITLERRGNAVFTRHDSGWVAVRDGAYRAGAGSGIVTHPGVVLRATRVTNIFETGTRFEAGGTEFVAAYFDTDLVVDGAAAPVPARRQLGCVKLSIPPLDPAAYAALIAAVGPMGGPVDAAIAIGGGPQRMRLHRVGVGTAAPEFAMAAWGSLAFPGGGDWSVLEAANAADAPTPVAADRGLPIVRQGAAGAPTAAAYRFADPEDLFDAASPGRDYGILHSMGTQRAFFRRPRIEPAAPHRLVSTERPVVADPFILATAVGPFPRQDDAIPFPSAAFALEVRADDTWRLDAPETFPAGVGRRTIRSAGTVRSDLDYAGATVTYAFDTAEPVPWRFGLDNAVKIMAHTAMGDLFSMSADIDARAGQATGFAQPRIAIGGPFDIVQDLLTVFAALGVPARPEVRMTNKWALSVGLTVPFVDAAGDDIKIVPGEPIPTIKFADTGLKIELAVAPEADEALLELGGSPMFAIKSVPGLYVVAIVKFKLQLSTESGTTYGFLLGVGIAYSLEAGPFELKGLFAITFFAVFGDTVLGYGVGFIVKLSAELPPIVAIEISLEGKLARLVAHKDLPDETVFQIAKLVFAIEVSVFLVFSISLEVETKQVEVLRGPLLASEAPDVL
ncbi:hypothetical protein LDO32_15545 [Luteimonas sp. Y-2-2-4F]|nr:hypothetical protein [Luteimonas sp. Y-2-2-4F]MCD9033141.1 hypothetical protein [Luteimonas sp. Y-2-2-4F]